MDENLLKIVDERGRNDKTVRLCKSRRHMVIGLIEMYRRDLL